MTAADLKLVKMTAELAAHKAVEEMEERLQCTQHVKEMAEIRPAVKTNTKDIKENRIGINGNRKMYFIGIGILFLGLIGEKLVKIFI